MGVGALSGNLMAKSWLDEGMEGNGVWGGRGTQGVYWLYSSSCEIIVSLFFFCF